MKARSLRLSTTVGHETLSTEPSNLNSKGMKKQGSWRRVLNHILFKQLNSINPRDLQKFQEIRQAIERQHSDILTNKASKRHYQFNSGQGASGQSREGRVE